MSWKVTLRTDLLSSRHPHAGLWLCVCLGLLLPTLATAQSTGPTTQKSATRTTTRQGKGPTRKSEKRVVAQRAEKLAATQKAAQKDASRRLQKIRALEKAIAPQGTTRPASSASQATRPASSASQATLLIQLAAATWKQATYLRFRELARHNAVLDRWDRKCRKLGDIKKCPPAPHPRLGPSDAFRRRSIKASRRFLAQYPRDGRHDREMLRLAQRLIEMKQGRKGRKLLEMLVFPPGQKKNSPHSLLIIEALVTLGRSLHAQNFGHTLAVYSTTLRRIKAALKDPTSTATHKRRLRKIRWQTLLRRGHLYLLARMGRRAQRDFKEALQSLSPSDHKTRKQAISSLVDAYYESNQKPQLVHLALQKQFGTQRTTRIVEKLAQKHERLGAYKRAIEAYRLLLRVGHKHKAPQYQASLLSCATRLWLPPALAAWKPKKLWPEVQALAALLSKPPQGKRRRNATQRPQAHALAEIALHHLLKRLSAKERTLWQPRHKKDVQAFLHRVGSLYLRLFPRHKHAPRIRKRIHPFTP